jgi:hypothetical protein
MVFLNLGEETNPLTASTVAERLAAQDVLVGEVGRQRFRLVAHYWIDDSGIDRAIASFKAALS